MRVAEAYSQRVLPLRGSHVSIPGALAFRLPAASEARPAQAIAAAIPGTVQRPGERLRAAVRGGRGLLDALDRLKAALLGGSSPDALAEVARRLRDQEAASGEPTLDEILDHIRLRADVELAKARVASRRDQLQPGDQQHDAERAQNAPVGEAGQAEA